jgi:SHAQKYF class myb-like DNA-binding protein
METIPRKIIAPGDIGCVDRAQQRGQLVALSGSKRKLDESMLPNAGVLQAADSEEEPPFADSEGGTSNDASELDDYDDDYDHSDDAWTEQQHQDFVAAIFDVGLKQSSPSVIMEHMTRCKGADMITSERIKSKLQKYRNNKEKSKQEFMDEYHSFLHRAKLMGGSNLTNPSSIFLLMGPSERSLLGGDVAGYLTFAASKGEGANRVNKPNTNTEGGVDGTNDGTIVSSHVLQQGILDFVNDFAGRTIPFPTLSEAEKNSPLGASMTFVMGLFFSMQQQLVRDREALGESTKGLKLTSSMEAAAAVATSAGMMGPSAVIDTTHHVVVAAAPATAPATKITPVTPRTDAVTGRVFKGKDFAVPSSAPQSQIYSALTTFLEREPSMSSSLVNVEAKDANTNDNANSI